VCPLLCVWLGRVINVINCIADDDLFLVTMRTIYMSNARAKSTNDAYRREMAKFRMWAKSRGRSYLPASYETVSRYVTAVAFRTKSVGMCVRVSAAIRAAHRVRNLATPTDSPAMLELMKGITRTYGKPPTQVAPLSKDMLRKLLRHLWAQGLDPVQERSAWLALLSFQMTARCGDIKKLQKKHFVFLKDGSMKVTFPSLKNIPVNKGFVVRVAAQQGRWCPVAFTKSYFENMGLGQDDFVLPVIKKRLYKNAMQFIVSKKQVASNGALRLHFRNALRDIGLSAGNFGLHSPRRGSATALAEGGFSAADLKSRVGWKSDAMVALYTSNSKKRHVSISRCLTL